MQIDLNKINSTSMSKIIFYDDSFRDDYDFFNSQSLDFFNIVICGNGIFQVMKTPLFITTAKIPVPYSNLKLKTLDDGSLYQKVRRPNRKHFDKIIDIFKYVNNKSKNELLINLYYDKKKDNFIIDITKQKISGGSVEYIYSEKYENNDRYIRYLQIHSHHNMGASFSPTDNRDEQNKIPCYYGVIGNLNSINFSYKFRIWNGIEFINVDISDVFRGFEEGPLKITKIEKNFLDKIIEDSKKKEEKKEKNFDDNFDIFSDVNIFSNRMV